MTSCWPPKYYHFTSWGAFSGHLQGGFVSISFAVLTWLLFGQGEGAALPSRALCSGFFWRGAAGEAPASSSSGPSTATDEHSHGAGTTSVRAHFRKRKMPSQVFFHVDKSPPEPPLGCSCAGGRRCSKIINTDGIFALAAIQFPSSFGFPCWTLQSCWSQAAAAAMPLQLTFGCAVGQH